MRIGKKFDQAKREYDESTKSFDSFCKENNIVVENTTKKKPAKKKFWLGFSTAFATAAVIVCAFIPLMLTSGKTEAPETPAKIIYGDNDIELKSVSLDNMLDSASESQLLMFNMDYAEEYTRANVIYARDDEIILGYHAIGVVYFTESDGTEFLYEFDYMIRSDDRYEPKDLALYQNCPSVISYGNTDYKYKVSKGDFGTNAYITFEYGDADYYICLYERDYTVELNDENIRAFIQLAF